MNAMTRAVFATFCVCVPMLSAAEPPQPSPSAALEALPGGTVMAGRYKRQGYTHLDFATLRQAATDSSLTADGKSAARQVPSISLRLFEDVTIDAIFSRVDDSAGYTWVGIPAPPHSGQVLFSIQGEDVIGRIDVGFDQYFIQGRTDGDVLVSEIAPASFEGVREIDRLPGFMDSVSKIAASKSAEAGTKSLSTTVDVLVLWTNAARAVVGSDAGAPFAPTTFIAGLIADANASFAASGVTATVRVVGYAPTAYQESGPNHSDWSGTVAAMRTGSGIGGQFNVFSTLPALRNSYAADIVVLLVDGNVMFAACGFANTWGSSSADSTQAFAMVSVTCAAGDRTFTHEIGHTLGGRHDTDTGSQNMPHDHNFGYTHVGPNFRTLMASGTAPGACNVSGCPRINRWSNPSLNFGSPPVPTGASKANMALTLATTVPAVAAYRAATGLTIPTAPTAMHGDVCEYATGPGMFTIRRNVTWPAPPGVVGWYEVQDSADAAFSSVTLGYRGPASYLATGFSGPVHRRVRACNAAGCSGYTTIVWRSPAVCT